MKKVKAPRHNRGIIGRQIIGLRPMTAKEAKREGWQIVGDMPTVIEIAGGHIVYPSNGPHNTGPGMLLGIEAGEQVAL